MDISSRLWFAYENGLTLIPYGIYQLFCNRCNAVQNFSLCQAAIAAGEWHTNGGRCRGNPVNTYLLCNAE